MIRGLCFQKQLIGETLNIYMIVFKNIFDFRSVFKPFIFVKHAHQLKLTTSPCYGPNDPVKKKPRFQSKPDRRHELFIKHEVVAAAIDSYKV